MRSRPTCPCDCVPKGRPVERQRRSGPNKHSSLPHHAKGRTHAHHWCDGRAAKRSGPRTGLGSLSCQVLRHHQCSLSYRETRSAGPVMAAARENPTQARTESTRKGSRAQRTKRRARGKRNGASLGYKGGAQAGSEGQETLPIRVRRRRSGSSNRQRTVRLNRQSCSDQPDPGEERVHSHEARTANCPPGLRARRTKRRARGKRNGASLGQKGGAQAGSEGRETPPIRVRRRRSGSSNRQRTVRLNRQSCSDQPDRSEDCVDSPRFAGPAR